jgi:P2 family phage major capsid protein
MSDIYCDGTTSKRISTLLSKTKKAYSLARDGMYFSVEAPKETKLKKAIMESNDFLKKVNMFDVQQIVGQAVTVGSDMLSTGRDKTRFAGTTPDIDGYEYKLSVTDTVIYITWARLAEWANSGGQKEFEKKLMEYITAQIGNDMLRVAMNGTHAAKVTDLTKYPNGEDINEGWHARILRVAPEQIVGSRLDDGAEIYFDPDGTRDADGNPLFDYKTLDAMVSDLINNNINPAFRNAADLVVLVGQDLVAAAQYRLYTEADKPTEHNAAQKLDKSIAGRPAYVVPYMPGKRLVVTSLKNLSIYTQKGTKRRKTKDNDDLGRVESFLWRFEGYMVEEATKYAAFDENSVIIGARTPGNVAKEPKITTALTSKTVVKGTDAEFTVVAENANEYQWALDGAVFDMTSTGTSTVTTTELEPGVYAVTVDCTGDMGSKQSAATLTVNAG